MNRILYRQVIRIVVEEIWKRALDKHTATKQAYESQLWAARARMSVEEEPVKK